MSDSFPSNAVTGWTSVVVYTIMVGLNEHRVEDKPAMDPRLFLGAFPVNQVLCTATLQMRGRMHKPLSMRQGAR